MPNPEIRGPDDVPRTFERSVANINKISVRLSHLVSYMNERSNVNGKMTYLRGYKNPILPLFMDIKEECANMEQAYDWISKQPEPRYSRAPSPPPYRRPPPPKVESRPVEEYELRRPPPPPARRRYGGTRKTKRK